MAIEWDIYLGTTGPTGKLSSFGRKVQINESEVTREQRSADGTLKVDILYTKKKFIFTWSNITESALDTIDFWYAYYQANKVPLKLYMYYTDALYNEYDVIPRPVDRTRLIKSAENLYSGVTFNLDEV